MGWTGKQYRLVSTPIVVAVVTAVAAMGVGVAADVPAAAATSSSSTTVLLPQDDPFYQPPTGFQRSAPGTILRSRKVSATAYVLPVPANVYQMLIRTTDALGNPVATVSTLFVPLTPASGPRNLMSYQIAIDSLGPACDPSYEMRTGSELDVTGELADLAFGWDTVITDFEGEDMEFAVGPMAGHAVLDGIRAAESLPQGGLATTSKVVAWGYSGGGQATAWAAQLQPSYAPGLQVVGYIAGDFPAQINTLLPSLNGGPFSGFVLAGAIGVMRAYPQLDSLLNAKGQALMGQIGQECQLTLVFSNAFENLNSFTTTDVFTSPAAKAVFAADSLGAVPPSAPVLLQDGVLDEIIPSTQGEILNQQWCNEGAQIDFSLSYVPEHVVNDLAQIPSSLLWAEARFLGIPSTDTCS